MESNVFFNNSITVLLLILFVCLLGLCSFSADLPAGDRISFTGWFGKLAQFIADN